jgi:hypothetical protein
LIIFFSPSPVSKLADLDCGVYFLGSAQGINCLPKDDAYIYYSGDASGTGVEYFTVSLGDSFTDIAWSGSTMVNLRAGWFGDTDYGMGNVTMYTLQCLPGESCRASNTIEFDIDPIASGSGNCPPQVANATVTIGVGGIVTITVTQ